MKIAKLLLFLFLFSSCFKITPQGVKREFTQCYDGSLADPSSQFLKNGYWYRESIVKQYDEFNFTKVIRIDTLIYTFVLFPDGIFLDILTFIKNDNKQYFGKIPEGELNVLDQWIAYGSHTGLYLLRNDTIIIQKISKSGNFSTPWYVFESWYKIIDQNTIVEIALERRFPYESKPSDFNSKTDSTFFHVENSLIYKFHPLTNLPSTDGWLIKKKWFWCDGKVGK